MQCGTMSTLYKRVLNMKKFGFTLTEVVIALGIIGIIAAVMAPLLDHLIPDKDKINVLKTYNVIRSINGDIKEDRTVWRETMDEDAPAWGHLAEPNNPDRDYPHIFAERLDIVEGTLTPSARGLQFDTTDGHHWTVEDYDNAYGQVIVDFMNEKRDRCTYSANCTTPGQFRFQIIANTLNTLPGDALTAAYIKNSQKLSDKKADYRTAKNDNHNYVLQ